MEPIRVGGLIGLAFLVYVSLAIFDYMNHIGAW